MVLKTLSLALLCSSAVALGANTRSAKKATPAKANQDGATARAAGEIERVLEVNNVEHKADHRIRIFMSATERANGVRFPISTIERNMVKVHFTNTATPPADAISLSILGSQPGDLKRAMFVAFDLDRTLNARALAEVKDRVSEIVADLPAQYLTVTALAQGSARIVADATPENSDNINRIQQQLAALAPEGDGPVLTDTLCVAAERFHAWNLNGFTGGDQKVLIIVSPTGDSPSSERFRGENCWRSLVEQKVRVFQVAYGKAERRPAFDLSGAAPDSGGFVHTVSGPLDILAAVKNVIANLRNEYVLDVDAPDISLEDQPLELSVKVAYHETVLSSDVHNVGFVIPSLAHVFSTKAAAKVDQDNAVDHTEEVEYARKMRFLQVLGLIVLGIVFLVVVQRSIRYRLRTASCSTCSARVKKDHSDCSFRKSDCIARLVFVSGPFAGMTFPLMRGPNRISAFAGSGVVLPRGGVSWFNHGTIVVDGFKAAYTPKKLGKDLVNGWPVHETRLLGIGHVLKIGKHQLRFEVKPQAAGK